MEFLGLLLALTLALVLSQVEAASSCPAQCSCTMLGQVSCSHLSNTTWPRFLQSLPRDTTRLDITHCNFSAELPLEDSTQTHTSFLLEKLSDLHISNSSLEELGNSSFDRLPNVTELQLTYVILSVEGLKGLSALSQVIEVDLSHNNIEQMPVNLLSTWPAIRTLELQNNKLSEFNFVQFHQSAELQMLDLSHNKIKFIHPESFTNGTSIDFLHLQSNEIQFLHPDTLANLSLPGTVNLGNNPWDCHCGMQWLVKALSANGSSLFQDASQIRCATPEHLQSHELQNLQVSSMSCDRPNLMFSPLDEELHFMYSIVMDCNFSGAPAPSVYWETPRGVVVHRDNRYWIPHELLVSPEQLTFSGPPVRPTARVTSLANGSLLLENFRYYFEGEYACVAVNPAGAVSYSFNVTIVANLQSTIQGTMIWGFLCAAGFLIIGILIGSLSFCASTVCCPATLTLDWPAIPADILYDDDYDDDEEESYYDDYDISPYWSNQQSPRFSPQKCVTPAEGYDPEHQKAALMASNIKDTLEGVRARLRLNMERQVQRMRSRAVNMRINSHKYMKNMRHVTGHAMKNFRHTSNHYAHKMRDGMVLGVEQVKYHVQSMKELCGTGDITHTISTISVSTDVDSNHKREVVKTITYV